MSQRDPDPRGSREGQTISPKSMELQPDFTLAGINFDRYKPIFSRLIRPMAISVKPQHKIASKSVTYFLTQNTENSGKTSTYSLI